MAKRKKKEPFRGVPYVITDTNFFRGSDDGFGSNEYLRSVYHRNARAAGIDTTGKVYCPELCRPGMAGGRDPEAWVPRTEGRSYIKKLLTKRRWSSTGRIEVPEAPRDTPPPFDGPYTPADDIVEAATIMDIKKQGLKKVSKQEFEKLKEANAKILSGNKNER